MTAKKSEPTPDPPEESEKQGVEPEPRLDRADEGADAHYPSGLPEETDENAHRVDPNTYPDPDNPVRSP